MAKNGNGGKRGGARRRHYFAEKDLTIAERRENVARMYHAGKTMAEIAEETGWAVTTVSDDIQYLKRKWYDSATELVGDWVARELAFAQEQRDGVLEEWNKSGKKNPALQQVLVKWTERIAKMIGTDAPDKVEDWTDKNWREFADAQGLEEADVLAEAEQILRDTHGSPNADLPDGDPSD